MNIDNLPAQVTKKKPFKTLLIISAHLSKTIKFNCQNNLLYRVKKPQLQTLLFNNMFRFGIRRGRSSLTMK
jgi:hypothetical protein